jgi:N-acetylmuramoyl-L-alanine amidase
MEKKSSVSATHTVPTLSRPKRFIDCLVVHCSATNPKADIGAKDIDRWHRKQGWKCIGYHFVIRRSGTIEKGRDITMVGAHVAGHNAHTVAICMAGGVDAKGRPENNFTPAQFASLQALLKGLVGVLGKVRICGHRDFPSVAKACPSFDVKQWLQEIQFNEP